MKLLLEEDIFDDRLIHNDDGVPGDEGVSEETKSFEKSAIKQLKVAEKEIDAINDFEVKDNNKLPKSNVKLKLSEDFTDSFEVGDHVLITVDGNRTGVISRVVSPDVYEVEVDSTEVLPARVDTYYGSDLERNSNEVYEDFGTGDSWYVEFTLEGKTRWSTAKGSNEDEIIQLVKYNYPEAEIIHVSKLNNKLDKQTNEDLVVVDDQQVNPQQDETPVETEVDNTSLISSLIQHEWESIDTYNGALMWAEHINEEVKQLIKEFTDNTYVHIGLLESSLKNIGKSSDNIDIARQNSEASLPDLEII